MSLLLNVLFDLDRSVGRGEWVGAIEAFLKIVSYCTVRTGIPSQLLDTGDGSGFSTKKEN
jgi:hypothetical protein